MNILVSFKKQHGKPQKPSYEVMPHSGRVFKAALTAKIEQAYANVPDAAHSFASHTRYSY